MDRLPNREKRRTEMARGACKSRCARRPAITRERVCVVCGPRPEHELARALAEFLLANRAGAFPLAESSARPTSPSFRYSMPPTGFVAVSGFRLRAIGDHPLAALRRIP